MSEPVEIAPGLLRWTARHPEWVENAEPGGPNDWDAIVGAVLYEAPGAVALIDPIVPGDERERFLSWLDRRVGQRPVSVLTTVRWHVRDRDELAERYDARTGAVPGGIVPKPLEGAGETVYWLPDAATLVPGDRLLGDGRGGLRLCPDSWLGRVRVDRRGLAELLRPLLELPVQRVLVSHGEPVLDGASVVLARAIEDAS
jgi:hypothetical protein